MKIDRDAAARDLLSVEDTRRETARDVECPPGYEAAAATSAGLNVAGVGMLLSDPVPLQVVGLVLVLAGAAGVGASIRRFRDVNGMWVSGYGPGPGRSTALVFAAVQVLVLTATIVATVALGWWWVGLVLALPLMAVFVAVNRRWLRVFRAANGLVG
jgi:hypothetical protein